MQNKHQKKFFVGGVPTSREGGGGQAGWDKIPSLSKELIVGLPSGLYINQIQKLFSFGQV